MLPGPQPGVPLRTARPSGLPGYFGRVHRSAAERARQLLHPYRQVLAGPGAQADQALGWFHAADTQTRANGRAWASLPGPAACHVELHSQLAVRHTALDTAGGLLVSWCRCGRRHLSHHAGPVTLLAPGCSTDPGLLLHY